MLKTWTNTGVHDWDRPTSGILLSLVLFRRKRGAVCGKRLTFLNSSPYEHVQYKIYIEEFRTIGLQPCRFLQICFIFVGIYHV